MIFTLFYLVYFSSLIHHFKFYAISDEYTAKIIKKCNRYLHLFQKKCTYSLQIII